MFQSEYYSKDVVQVIARASILALIVAGFLGITHVSAANPITQAAQKTSLNIANSCDVGMQSRDYYPRQEEAILSVVTQSNWNAAEIEASGGSNLCAAGNQSGDYYLRQEEAVLGLINQGNGGSSEMASLHSSFFAAQTIP